jgi:glycosyltransferase involved in cell wall biosynthesis
MRVLFVTNEPLGPRLSGPGIRCLELARALAGQHIVSIAALQPGELQIEKINFLPDALRRKRDFVLAARSADVVVTQGMALARVPTLRKLAKHLVIDLYDPYLFEYLQHPHPTQPAWGYLRQWHRLNQQMLAGDFFLCANELQWDYWLGRFCALGRLDPPQFQQDSSFRSLLAVVPFGLPSAPPVANKKVLRDVLPGMAREDFILLWAGGLWQWLDPLTPIRALAKIAPQNPRVKLLFLGARDPNPNNRAMSMAEQARALAITLGLMNKSVFFYEEWVPYAERHNFLLEASAGISAHPASVETRFAFRTRVLDYLWAALPMLLSSGDDFGDRIEAAGAGLAIAPGDVEGWEHAILRLAQHPALCQQMSLHAQHMALQFGWDKVAASLARYCEAPYTSPRPSRLRRALLPLLAWGFDAGLRR